jgi:hypothetical protein
MKHLIIYSGIALVVIANIINKSFDTKSGVRASQPARNEVVASKGFKTIFSEENNLSQKQFTTIKASTKLKSRTLSLRNFTSIKDNDFNIGEEPIEGITINNSFKTADALIAEDNLITENNISNETQALDFDIINENSTVYEVIESAIPNKIEKTTDELIAEDNTITENNFSNETQALDFNVINRNSIVEEVIEIPTSYKIEKTADQLITEDNLITENNISNETLALDFEIINKKLVLVSDNDMN